VGCVVGFDMGQLETVARAVDSRWTPTKTATRSELQPAFTCATRPRHSARDAHCTLFNGDTHGCLFVHTLSQNMHATFSLPIGSP
jgi:hypothetical protein